MKKAMIIKGIVFVAFVACLSGAFDSKKGSASNHYNEGSASDTANMIYNIASADEDIKSDDWNYDPTVINEERIAKKAEAVAKESGREEAEVKEELLTQATENRALYLAALDAGITVTQAEVDESINTIKEAFHNDEEAKEELAAILAGYGISEEEYWEKTRSQYEAILIINKYLNLRVEEMDVEDEEQSEAIDEITDEAVEEYGE